MLVELICSIPTDLYIDGRWPPSIDGSRTSVVDSATEQVFAEVASGGTANATTAVYAASEAAAGWAGQPPRVRAEVQRKAFELMTERREDLATIISRKDGESLADGLGEVAYVAEFFRW